MAERSYSREWTGMLADETARWVHEGIIHEGQRDAILALYPSQGEVGRDRTVLIFSILGSLLVGAGVVLFFAANWQAIPAAAKLAAILVAVVGAYGAGYYLQYVRGDYPRVGHSLIFLGTLLYGAGIWLVAQMFHLDTHYPTGFLLWGLGVLPVVWAATSRPVLYLGTALLLVWTMIEQAEFASYNALFPVLALGALLPLSRKLKDAIPEAVVLGGLFLWFAVNATTRGAHPAAVDETQQWGRLALFYGAAVMAGGLARVGDLRAYVGVGAFLASLGSYVLTFKSRYLSALPAITAETPFTLTGVAVILAALAAAGWLYWRKAEPWRAFLLPAVLVPVLGGFAADYLDVVPRMIAFNLLLFAGTIGLIALGVQRRSSLLVNLGLAIFVIHILTRYFDLFFSAMNKSLFFVVGGVLLLGGGWLLERNRRRWMRDWGGVSHDA